MSEHKRIQEENKIEAEKLYQEFTDAFGQGMCDSCGKSLRTFSKTNPCFHWLLRPGKSKKKDILQVLSEKGYFRCASYIRWVANFTDHYRNINNLKEEGNREAVFHWSAKHEHRKWTFWCTREDYEGHGNQPPHYHFEMRLNGMPFIKFNDFHIPFTDEDLFNLRSHEDPDSPVKQTFGYHGAGIEEAFSGDPEKILDGLKTTTDENEAFYHIHTVLTSDEGIPGEVVEEAMRRSKDEGIPAAETLREKGYEPMVAIEPAESLLEKETRNNPRKKKD